MRVIIAMTSAILAASAIGSAAAQTPPDSLARISFADLDLRSPDGRATLEQRVSHAVDRVCPPTPLPQELAKQHYARVCRENARREADRQLESIYGARVAQADVRMRPAGR